MAESWEEEELSSEEETEISKVASTEDMPHAPPPTPVAQSVPSRPGEGGVAETWYPEIYTVDAGRSTRSEARPEKTDAVARRMIAGALGVRTPKKTDDQREYEKAVKEKEMRKRNKEREAEEEARREAERAKNAIWED